MTVILTGPGDCAHCGVPFDVEALEASPITGGEPLTVPAYVTIKGHRVRIPCLYWHAECAARIEAGAVESTLTLGSAREFLAEIMGPRMLMAGLVAMANGDDDMARKAASRVVDIAEVDLILETVISELEIDPVSGLDFIPECRGRGHGPDVAHLN